MLGKVLRVLGGDPQKRELEEIKEIVNQINALEMEYERLSDDELRAKTDQFKQRLSDGETLDDLLVEAFAAVREASKRTLGLRHYDVQLIGGVILHRGKIAEMRTGEGKTLVATLPIYLNALTGRGVHLVTVNDYLARRDARWMAPIYHALGMSVGVLQMASRTENGRMAFLVDFERTSPHEDQHNLRMVLRAEAYKADITYGTNSEFGFDYLRDNLTMRLEDRVQRGHYYAIVDEVDNVLIDEARTPLIISGPAQEETEWYLRMAQIVRQLQPEDYEIDEKDRAVSLTEVGEAHVEELLDMPLRDPERPEDITPEQARILGYLEQALRAQHLYRRNKDYLVQNGKVIIIDEFTGRLMPGRRWSEGLHQAIEAKEGVKIEPANVTYATITLQNYFRMYEKLAGMTGTALTEAEEFGKIYKLDVFPIPTNLEYIASLPNSHLVTVEAKDEQGYKYTYYAERNDPQRKPVFWKRKDYPDVVYRTQEAKLRAIAQEIIRYHVMGRPQLVGTTSVEHSELLSERLQAEPVRRLLQTLLIRQVWMEQNHIEVLDRQIPELQILNKPLSELNPGELRPLARNLNLTLNLEEPQNLQKLLAILDLSAENAPRLLKVIQGGVPHQVLNARKHDEESQIIARAGAFGMVTIATNMAGRGVDIKLGGELPEAILRDVNRVLSKVSTDPYDMTNEERREALLEMPPEEYGIYEESVKSFLQYMEDMQRVRDLGGLHVIGSERHEARRIDNQLRGRSARQGDPGSSRFYLSLEDDLMRLFGGQQVEGLWKRIFFDDSLPLEMNMIGRMVEQSQERVEGANFDVRKHLLEYDDVLNSQRNRIYRQRDQVFTKENLIVDVLEMLKSEVQERIPKALKDEEGPWKLLAYLDQIQPPLYYDSISWPSFTFRLLIDDLRREISSDNPDITGVRDALLRMAERALEAERTHVMRSVQNRLEQLEKLIRQQQDERLEILDNFLDTLREGEEAIPYNRPQELLAQISDQVHVALKLTPDQLRRLPEGDRDVRMALQQQVESSLQAVQLNRMILALEKLLEEQTGLRSDQLQGKSWEEASSLILDAVERLFELRKKRLLGEQGQIRHDVDNYLSRLSELKLDDRQLTDLLLVTAQGSRLVFDAKTHQKRQKIYYRLRYVYLAATLVEETQPQRMTEQVLEHLEEGLGALRLAYGLAEWQRLTQLEATLQQLDEKTRNGLIDRLGEQTFEALAEKPLNLFSEKEREPVIHYLGWRLQNELFRQILLHAISELWVEYLTKVESLRVSIGLEAYAQRDPLVQYKSRASEMFRELLSDIRMAVINRIFTVQPRREEAAAVEKERNGEKERLVVQSTAQPAQIGSGKKKKRHRH